VSNQNDFLILGKLTRRTRKLLCLREIDIQSLVIQLPADSRERGRHGEDVRGRRVRQALTRWEPARSVRLKKRALVTDYFS
jgi:hypothetical protein